MNRSDPGCVELRTQRLVLRPTGPEYQATAWVYSSDPETTRFMMNLPNETEEECLAYLKYCAAEWHSEQPEAYEFAILQDGEHIGGVGLFPEGNACAELGWILRKDKWGQGIATEAARAVVDFGVRELGVRRFSAHCDAENIGSARVMEKLGMHLIHREWGRKNKGSDEDREELTYIMDI